jgi:hypothetical protein
MDAVATAADEKLWKVAESDEVEIETRRDATSPSHRTIIWMVPTKDGVYIRSVKGGRGRWYREATANPWVVIHRGRERVRARVEHEKNATVIREVSDAYRLKYNERWPDETDSMLREHTLPTTLRVIADQK